MARVTVTPGLLRLHDDGAGEGVQLVGGYSPSSGRYHFPLAPVCPYTGAEDVEEVALSGRGTLWSWTAVTAAPPGYLGEVPYGFGVVELEEGLRVVGRLTEADPERLRDGQPMRLVGETVFVDEAGDEVVTWAFAPEESGGG